MKPFNLEAAIAGEHLITRDGQTAKFIAYVPELHKSQRVITNVGGVIHSCDENGYYLSGGAPSTRDLFMAPKKRTVWVNLYPDNVSCWNYPTQKMADEGAGHNRIGGKAYPIEIEE